MDIRSITKNLWFSLNHPLVSPVKSSVLGLDIGNFNIKSVEITRLKDKIELSGHIIERIQNGNTLSAIVRIAENFRSTKKVRLSLSGSGVVIRYIYFPRMSPDELKGALKFEAEKHIPFSIKETTLDGYILKEDPTNNRMLVLVAAAKNDLIEQRLTLIKDAGLEAEYIDVDSLAVINCFNFINQQANQKIDEAKFIALLNIGAKITNLDILENGIPCLSRNILIGGDDFTKKIASDMKVEPKSAEELKCNPQGEKFEEIIRICEPVFTVLASEIRNSFDYYESQSSNAVEKIYLSGGGSFFKGLDSALSNILETEAKKWDPCAGLDIKSYSNMDDLNEKTSLLTVAMGLALRE